MHRKLSSNLCVQVDYCQKPNLTCSKMEAPEGNVIKKLKEFFAKQAKVHKKIDCDFYRTIGKHKADDEDKFPWKGGQRTEGQVPPECQRQLPKKPSLKTLKAVSTEKEPRGKGTGTGKTEPMIKNGMLSKTDKGKKVRILELEPHRFILQFYNYLFIYLFHTLCGWYF